MSYKSQCNFNVNKDNYIDSHRRQFIHESNFVQEMLVLSTCFYVLKQLRDSEVVVPFQLCKRPEFLDSD